MQRDLKVLV